MSVIEINQLTKDYGGGRGIFNVSLSVSKGEVFGFLGPNGAGKSTTIRHLMGFIHGNSGSCKINGLDCMEDRSRIQKKLGCLPGEIAFMDDMTGIAFIKFAASVRGMKDLSRAYELMEMFELNASGKIKKMSKGMKQKVGIVCAFMHDPEILILDEPTSGLRGKTIFMSSHIFEEIERTCDRTAMIKDGHLIAVEDVNSIKASKHKSYVLTFATEEEASRFTTDVTDAKLISPIKVKVHYQGTLPPFLKLISEYKIMDLDTTTPTLEELFLHFYGRG